MGTGAKGLMLFCYLNSVCAFLIAYFFRVGMVSMAIVAAERNWKASAKAGACRNAGIMYAVLAVVLTVKNYIDDRAEARLQRQSYEERMAEYERFGVQPGEASAERRSLLGSNNSQYGSTGSSPRS